MFGRVHGDNQSLYIGTGKLLGIQSYSISNNFGNFSLKYLGIGNKPISQVANAAQYSDLILNSLLINDDVLIQQTGGPINCFIMKNQYDTNPYSLISGYLNSYTAKFAPNQIPETNASFRFYKNAGNIYTGNLDSKSFGQLSGIYNNTYAPFNGYIGNSNYINLTINESTGNRISNFQFSIEMNRLPIYNVGSISPIRVDTIYPVNFTCDLSFEADDNFVDVNQTDFPSVQIKQNIEVDVYSHLSNNLMSQYKFFNMTLISNKRDINVDGNLVINRSYIGQIFQNVDLISGANIWDFGFVASGINFFLDWGSVNSSATSTLDFGGLR